MKQTTHLPSVDLLRGLAALSVCIFHFTNGNKSLLPDDNLLKQIGSFGFLGVEVFFIISGMVIPYAMHGNDYQVKNLGRFLARRLIRLEPPYLVSIILILGLNYISTLFPFYAGQPFNMNPTSLTLHLGYLIPFTDYEWINPVYWSLAIEFQFYLLMALTFPLLSSSQTSIRLGFLAACLACFLFISLNGFIFSYLVYFTIGFTLYQQEKKIIDPRATVILIALCLVLIGFQQSLAHVTVCLLMISIFYLFRSYSGKSGLFLGQISYSLYLTHVPIGGRVINLAVKFTEHENLKYLAIASALGVSIAFAWMFYQLVERPAMRWAKKVNYQAAVIPK